MAWTRNLLDEKQIRKERQIYKENFYGAITYQDTSVKDPYSESMEYNARKYAKYAFRKKICKDIRPQPRLEKIILLFCKVVIFLKNLAFSA